uniref:Uncharacterized protein n=1 Tax=Tetranychus urticae TaxID=32264 RepID=T1JXG8_TETUR
MIFFLKPTLTISIQAICIAIFAWQFYLLTRNYTEFNVRKEVTYYIPNEIELPEIRMLIPYQFALDPVILRTKYKTQVEKTCSYLTGRNDCDAYLTKPVLFSGLIGPHLLLSDIANHSYAPEMLIQHVYLSGSKENPLKSGECKLTSQASSLFMVLILKCLDSSNFPIKISRGKTVVYSTNYLLAVSSNVTTMSLNLNYPGKALLEDDSLYTFSSANPGKEISHKIRFTKHTETSLPPPYKTMCKNYDRRQTFEDCLNAQSIEQMGMLFPGTTVPLDKYSDSSQMRYNSAPYNDNGTLFKIYEQCQSLVTRPMCSSVQYELKMSNTVLDVPKGKEQMVLLFSVSPRPDSITESKAEFPLIDYLILSGSLFSSWFGISIMGQLLAASNLLFLAVERKSTAVIDQPNEAPKPEVCNEPD